MMRRYFYPRSPCGERPLHTVGKGPALYFYPRSPCGERHTQNLGVSIIQLIFLSTLSLRRATFYPTLEGHKIQISIHALLAESDPFSGFLVGCVDNFYPRSPCGERLLHGRNRHNVNRISIHALLAESDNLRVLDGSKSSIISIHALLAESDGKPKALKSRLCVFLSTLSLRRATYHCIWILCRQHRISIHALLAESDQAGSSLHQLQNISIHALLAESDRGKFFKRKINHHFYPRSPCGERPKVNFTIFESFAFLSTLSLRRATT